VSHRRLPKPRWHRYAAMAAGVIVMAGGATWAVAAGGNGGSTTGAAPASAPGVTGPSNQASPGALKPLDGTASPSASPSGSATPSASATASGGTTTPAVRASLPARVTAAPGAGGGASRPSTAPEVFTGLAFDTCTAPSAATMSAWRAHSPYGAAAVYVGGRNRGCAQPQLTASWVRTVTSAGWRLVPLYVGAQPPCQTSSNPERITASNASSLGATDGADAVAKAQALGMRVGSAVYLDMEAFDSGDTACVSSVLTYIRAWDRALHARGYWAGFYGFTSSSAAVVAQAKSTTADMPDALWYAKYDGNATTTTGFPFSSGLFTGHRRGHQYLVNQKESYGGATVTVDRDAWDAPVAVVG
jgi:Domain of unknown function (DUF1906)